MAKNEFGLSNRHLRRLETEALKIHPPEMREMYLNTTSGITMRALELIETINSDSKKKYQVSFRIIVDPVFDATASPENGGTITLTSGLIISLFNYFNFALADPSVMAAVGRVHELTNKDDFDKLKRSLFQRTQEPLLTRLHCRGIFLPPPPELLRQKIAFYLFRTAVDFIILHELTHIWHGHVELLKRRKQASSISELGLTRRGHIELADMQSFEMDADRAAAFNTIYEAYEDNYISDYAYDFHIPQFEQNYGKKATTVILSIIAVYSVFKLFGEGTWDLDYINREDHPPADVRRLFVGASQREFLMSRFNMDHMPGIETVARLAADEIYAEFFGLSVSDVPGMIELIERTAEYARLVNANWDKLEPHLRPLMRG